MSNQYDCNINFNIQIDDKSDLYQAVRAFSIEQAKKHFKRKDAVKRMTLTLEKIVSNLLRGSPSNHIAMRKEKVDKETRYQGNIYKHKYRKLSLDILDELDFIAQQKGSRYSQKQTIVYPSHKLFSYFSDYGLASYYIKQDELIVLRDTITNKKIKKNIEYEETNETTTLRKEVVEINNYLRTLNITYTGSSTSTLSQEYDTPYIPLVGPLYRDTTRNQVYRVFSHGSFELGGRMYGAFWINLKKKLRQGMTINGGSCSEVDFNSMHIAQLYAKEGFSHSDDYDAYDIPELQAMKISRTAIKKQVQRMINSTKVTKSFIHCSDETIRREFKGIDYDAGVKPILNKHKFIDKYFHSGIGLRLAYDESRIMIDVIKKCIELDIPTLPLHDALITQSKHAKKVQELMQERFFEFYGAQITAGIKHL